MTMRLSRETCTWLTALLLFFIIIFSIIEGDMAQEHHKTLAEDYLNSMLEYLDSNVSPEGVVWGYEGSSAVKATVKLGLLAGYVHMGLRDSDSLIMLNRIGKALNGLLEEFDELSASKTRF